MGGPRDKKQTWGNMAISAIQCKISGIVVLTQKHLDEYILWKRDPLSEPLYIWLYAQTGFMDLLCASILHSV